MAGHTWKPGLIIVLKHANHYISKWQPQLSQNLTTPEYNCLLTTLAAIQACLALLVQP